MYKEIFIALLSGLTASAIGAYTQYAITLKQVEAPKLALEERKAQLDAHRQILALSPITNTTCTANRWNTWSWRIQCDTKSSSQYPVWVKITNVTLSQSFDAGRREFKEGEGFDLFYPQERRTFVATPHSNGYLEFFVIFKKQSYPKGLNFDGLIVQPNFEYAVVESARKSLEQTFPEQAQLISEVAKAPQRILTVALAGSATHESQTGYSQ